MRSTLATPLLAATAALALFGCSITVKTTDDASSPSRKAAASNTPSRKAAKPSFRSARPGTTRPGDPRPASGTISTPTTDLAPRITSPIIFGNGTGGAFTGHAYVIPEKTDTMPDFSVLVPFATLFTDSFNIPSQQFSGGFPGALVQEEWFGIRYEGVVTIPKDGDWQFKVTSDDGAVLYIDSEKVVSNHGLHTAKTATGQKNLKSGRHQLRLDYFQGPKGPVALIVQIVEDGKDRVLTGTK